MILWITGRKGSGKTTLAKKLQKQLKDCIVLDGDEIRALTGNFDFTDAGRILNQKNITEMAKLHENAIIACVSPIKSVRNAFQKELGALEIQLPFGELWEGTEYEE